ncbi:MAG: amidohydrolase family protein [Candidatus Marinimicrobia bacterium]|nr:amidohydrolase family protein [Candidatus Neomarinimicrobiota bacterium]
MKLIYSITLLFSLLFASDQIPGPPQDHPIIFTGATIHTVSHGVLENAEILFDGGKIISVGHNLSAMYKIEKIDISGKHIFPGLISAGSTLGLQEIGAVRATRDYAEVGSINPNVRANVSYNPDSEIIPISRSNGILLALSVPRSGRMSGMSSLMMLDGWTWEDATLQHPVGLHLFWPSMNVAKSDKAEKKDKSDKESRLKSIQKIDDLIQESRAYLKLKESRSSSFKHDLRLEGMLSVLTGDIPVFIHANEVRQIEAAVYWADRQNLEMVLVGGKDSWRTTTLLKDRDIPVIYTQTHSTPMRRFENYDQAFTTPFQLFEAGVKFCISNSESPFQTPHIRNLPYHAAKAASYGLPWEEALRSITLSTAEILGVDEKVGSLEVGKEATLFIADGDILDIRTQVERAFIQGREIDLTDRHKTLYKKYKIKYQQNGLLKGPVLE